MNKRFKAQQKGLDYLKKKIQKVRVIDLKEEFEAPPNDLEFRWKQ